VYTPESFKISDLPTLHADMERWNFATLITPGPEGELQVTHLPLLLKRDSGRLGTLAGHVAKANPHWKAFGAGRESTAIFHGPHAYISPRWYRTEVAVPTWNYVAVHAHGAPSILQEAASVESHLRQLIRHHEGTGPDSWRPDKLSRETFESLMKAVVCFEMPIARIEGKAKLSQNRPPHDVPGVIQGLQASDRTDNHELADMMQRRVVEPQGQAGV
jgi:transcriptional regulator